MGKNSTGRKHPWSTQTKGDVSELTEEQKQKFKRLLGRGALACGFEVDRRMLQRVVKLIEREFKVAYHPNYLNRLLTNLGFC